MNDQALMAYLEAVRDRPFEWGAHDCCRFAAGAVEAMTGSNPMAEFLGTYSDRDSARAALTKIGAGTLYHTLLAKFGRSLHPSRAQRGDIAYAVHEGPTLGICLGQDCAFVGQQGQQKGLVMFPTLTVQRIFRHG
jgi:hypothetical protein